ncbi:MAG TPA: 5-formyltetrahydrofolate cyclo-ligase [Vicinamibacteria bacterium]|nr:5-formyltetrahydrofolate cyclo-ligase [Vicinamibacteria bacterium]
MTGKQELRERVWKRMEEMRVGRFPGTRGRIPNFIGAERAAERLEELDSWRKAGRIKANPDSPQAPARKRALQAGKVVYMAVPRLRDRACFIELDPARLTDLHKASSIKGAFQLGRPLALDAVEPIDFVLCGSVAVTRDGRRLGKGGGFSDLEFALLMQAGKLSQDTPIVTTVHPVQIVAEVPAVEHDFRLDHIVTPDETIRCRRPKKQPRGIDWELLGEEKLAAIPILQVLRSRAASAGKK